jgi:glycosyltransferase involved in cell wall biosynthesis
MTELVRRLDRNRFDVHVVCFHREGSWLPRVEACAPVVEFPISGFTRPKTFARAAEFARWCRSHRIAVVHTCDLYANTFALPAAAVAGVPVRVGSRRELAPDKSLAQLALQRQAYRCAHAVVANSAAAAQCLRQEGVAADRIRVISNGIQPDGFASVRTAGPLTRILTVANLRREKAHEVLFGAIARIAPRHPSIHLRVAGDGPRAAELMALAASLGIADRVDFLGHRDDVPTLLAEADLFVLPSRSEAFPNAVVEAMAAGLPVVASGVGGLLELVESGRTGVLVAPDDPRALADAIEDLVNDPSRARSLGDAARRTIAEHYSFERMVHAFEDLYRSLLPPTRSEAA